MFLSFILFALPVSFAGCGDSHAPAPEDGRLQLSLKWNPQPAETLNYTALTQSPSDNVREDFDTDAIHAVVFNQAGEEEASATWECAERSARLDDIEVGTDKVEVDGMIAGEVY